MALVYLFSAIFKSNMQWLRGEAIAGVLEHNFYASPASAYLLQFPRLLTGMTLATFVLDWAAPLLLFSPICTARLRLGILAALATMHVSIGICLEVGLFSHVSLAGLVLFLPAEFWNSHLLARFSRRSERDKELADAGKHIAKEASPLFYITQTLCMMLLIYVLAVNINGLPSHPLAPLAPEKWKPLTTAFGLGQRWGMFDEIPSMDGWYVARAKLKDGSAVDLLRQGVAVDWNKPAFPARMYPNHFWQKLFREMAYDDAHGFQLLRAPVAEFLCRTWNARNTGEKEIAEFEFIYCMLDKTEEKNMPTPQVLRQQLVHLDLSDP